MTGWRDRDGQRRGGPQWSPPLSSGMTRQHVQGVELPHLPQWSPPLSSGMTLVARRRR